MAASRCAVLRPAASGATIDATIAAVTRRTASLYTGISTPFVAVANIVIMAIVDFLFWLFDFSSSTEDYHISYFALRTSIFDLFQRLLRRLSHSILRTSNFDLRTSIALLK